MFCVGFSVHTVASGCIMLLALSMFPASAGDQEKKEGGVASCVDNPSTASVLGPLGLLSSP